jgi:hypothetical protein
VVLEFRTGNCSFPEGIGKTPKITFKELVGDLLTLFEIINLEIHMTRCPSPFAIDHRSSNGLDFA